MAAHDTLIERLQLAPLPDRRLDGEIHNAIYGTAYVYVGAASPHGFHTSQTDNGCPLVPFYTASLDAAIALAERALPGHGRCLAKGRMRADEPMFACQIYASEFCTLTGEVRPIADGEHDIEAVAIGIAMLRAMQGSRH